MNESHLFGSRIHGQGRHPIFYLKYSDKVWQMKNIKYATLICKWRSNMPISPEVLRQRENHVQNLTLTALRRAVVFLIFYSGLYGFLTNLKNKANIILLQWQRPGCQILFHAYWYVATAANYVSHSQSWLNMLSWISQIKTCRGLAFECVRT